MTATTGPTLLEELHALEVTAHRLATERDDAAAERADLAESNRQLRAERDAAFQMAAQATKDLVRVRREMQAQIDLRDTLIDSLRINDDRKNDDLRRLNARVRELALADEDKQRQLEATQQESETPPPRRRSLKRAGNRKDRS